MEQQIIDVIDSELNVMCLLDLNDWCKAHEGAKIPIRTVTLTEKTDNLPGLSMAAYGFDFLSSLVIIANPILFDPEVSKEFGAGDEFNFLDTDRMAELVPSLKTFPLNDKEFGVPGEIVFPYQCVQL